MSRPVLQRAPARIPPALTAFFLLTGAVTVAQTTTLARLVPPTETEVGGEFSEIARADFDGDGIDDLATGQPSDGSAGRVVIRSGATGAPLRAILPAGAPEAGDGFGKTVLRVADLDSDGVPDLVIGSPSSPTSPRVGAYSSATGQMLWQLVSPIPGIGLGWSLALIEDLNGDGRQDLVIGAPNRTLVQTSSFSTLTPSDGRSFVASGSDGSIIFVLQSAGNPGLAPTFGASVISVGDIDGDSVDEVVVTSGPGIGPGGIEVQVFSGATGNFIGILAQRAFGTLSPVVANHSDINADGFEDILFCYRSTAVPSLWAVECLSGVGAGVLWSHASTAGGGGAQSVPDLDGDSVNDVLIANGIYLGLPSSAPSFAMLSGATGAAIWSVNPPQISYVIPTQGNPVTIDADRDGDGRGDLLVTTSKALQGNQIFSISSASGAVLSVLGSRPGVDGFGTAILRTSDMDADGLDDVLIGAPRFASAALKFCGAAYLLSSATGAQIRRFEGSVAYQTAGMSLAELGDINADGVSDFALGSPFPGFAPASLAGQVDVHSGSNGSVLWTAIGSQPFARFGTALLRVPDRNGDGVADIVVAASRLMTTPPSIRLLSGANGQTLWIWNAPGLTSSIGSELTDAGDLNGDGVSDLIVNGAAPHPTGVFQTDYSPIVAATPSGLPIAGPVFAISGANGALIWSRSPVGAEAIGFSLTMTSDRDGDGVADILAGSPGFPSGDINASGRVLLLSGANGALISVVATGLPGELLGVRVTSLGDLDGDLVPEFAALTSPVNVAVNNPTVFPMRNRLRVFSGATFEVSDVLSSAPYTTILQSDGFGFAMSPMADLNGDGFPEFLMGAPNSTDPVSQIKRGAVDLVSVRPATTVVTQGSGCPLVLQGTSYALGIGTVGGVPSVQTGNPTFGISLTGAPASGLAVLFYGVPTATWNGLPLPLDLAPYGYPGCSLELGPDEFVAVPLPPSSPPGTLTLNTPIPQLPNLSGAEVLIQWVLQFPGPVIPALGTTPALRIRLL